MPELTAEFVRQRYTYDPEEGELRWVGGMKGRRAGAVAGCRKPRGYTMILINGKEYRAHRIIWLWMTGSLPSVGIDHIDGDGHNNRWGNLREATQAQNLRNVRTHRDNKQGLKGVHKARNRFEARICVDYRSMTIGYYDTPEEAHEAYKKAAYILHGEFARTA